MISLEEIGVIRTPYKEKAPFQPDEKKEDCRVEVYERYSKGLYKLDSFRYIYLIYYMHKVSRTSLLAHPPSLKNIEVGVFASRSPFRPNHIAISFNLWWIPQRTYNSLKGITYLKRAELGSCFT